MEIPSQPVYNPSPISVNETHKWNMANGPVEGMVGFPHPDIKWGVWPNGLVLSRFLVCGLKSE